MARAIGWKKISDGHIEATVVKLETVDVISAGYEWTCGKCGDLMREIEFNETVECSKCGTEFKANPPEHAYG